MDYIPQFEPWLGEEEKKLLCECIDDNWITGGDKVREFENRIAALCRVKHAVACFNGTMALYMALKAMGVGEGDEVIVPDFTFIASANAVVMAGATPVFVDIDRETLNIKVDALMDAITPVTKAIMPVHIYGRPADMYNTTAFASCNNLKVLEDAAQGVGVSYDGMPVGGIGDAGILSFYADKTMTTGEGGMVLTNNDDIAEKCIRLSHLGNLSKGRYIHDTIGFNFRMTDLQAAVGLAQLGRLSNITAAKKLNEALYKELLSNTPGVTFIEDKPGDVTVPFRIVVFVDNPQGLLEYLKTCNIGTNRVFYPLHMQPCYEGARAYPTDNFPNSIWAYEHGLALPSSAKLTQAQVKYICQSVDHYQRHNYVKEGVKE